MKDFIHLSDLTEGDIYEIFNLADELCQGGYREFLKEKTIVLFFPESSIRTRVTFEKGIYLLGGQPVLFPMETLDKKEEPKDVCGYLDNWADAIVVRHKNLDVVRTMANYANVPVVNAMTSVNHPCEILTDLYALSKIRKDLKKDKYLFCGVNGNIGLTWKEASRIMGFELEQCCGAGYEIDGLVVHHDIRDAIVGKDIVCTDSLPAHVLDAFRNCQVTLDVMKRANEGAILNPCPPFCRGEEVSADVIDSDYFVGYVFKKYLLEVQQAILIHCMMGESLGL